MELLKHPTKEQAVNNLLETRRNSRRAINRCKKSATRFEWHLTQIEESEEELLKLGVIKREDFWQQ